MATPGMNTTGTPDAIDSTDYVMTIIRAIRRFPAACGAQLAIAGSWSARSWLRVPHSQTLAGAAIGDHPVRAPP